MLLFKVFDHAVFKIRLNLNVFFSVNNLFTFPVARALLIGDVMMNKRSGVKMFLSVITAPIALADLINFLNRRYHVSS
jgi:hypothetical protein